VNRGRSTPVHVVPRLDDMAARVADLARPGDLVITLGAGSIGSLAGHLVAELERRHGGRR
jgi:UDP-N-acetylmuramate--alanine ligase